MLVAMLNFGGKYLYIILLKMATPVYDINLLILL